MRRVASGAGACRGRGGTLSESEVALSELVRRFASFRADNPRGARVPAELRAATLAALQQGVALGALYRTCGVSWSQVVAWKAQAGVVAPADPASQEVGVFSVVDGPTVPCHDSGLAVPPWRELELRLGPWSVRVRLADAEPSDRGQACSR